MLNLRLNHKIREFHKEDCGADKWHIVDNFISLSLILTKITRSVNSLMGSFKFFNECF